jgi:hypothetical protein
MGETPHDELQSFGLKLAQPEFFSKMQFNHWHTW